MRRFGGKLRQAVEEPADRALQTRARGLIECGLHLLHGSQKRVEPGLLLRLRIDAELKRLVANTLDVDDLRAGAELKMAEADRVRFRKIGALPGVSRRVQVGN